MKEVIIRLTGQTPAEVSTVGTIYRLGTRRLAHLPVRADRSSDGRAKLPPGHYYYYFSVYPQGQVTVQLLSAETGSPLADDVAIRAGDSASCHVVCFEVPT